MKRIQLTLLVLFISASTFWAKGDMYVRVLIPDEALPSEAKNQLENKIKQLASNYVLVDVGANDRFFLSANALTVTKDVIASTPPRISMKLDITLFFGDVIEGKLYGSHTITVAGIGINENKAFIYAINHIPTKNNELESFFNEMEEKVKSYYLDNGSKIIKDAELLVKTQGYVTAIASLLSIPGFCGEISDQAKEVAAKLYQQKINTEGEAIYKRAENLWRINKDNKAAAEVVEMLSSIDVGSEYSDKGQKLVKTIAKYYSSQQQKEEERAQQDRDFKIRQYEDDLELRRQALKDQTSIERAKVEAMNKAAEKANRIDIKKVTNIIKGWF